MYQLVDDFLSAYESSYNYHYKKFPQESWEYASKFPQNDYFNSLDVVCLHGVISLYHPSQIIEIGGGYSTTIMRDAEAPLVISMDPQPRTFCADSRIVHIREKVSKDHIALFDRLNAKDILFVDGSHRATPESDVELIFTEILPRLNPGVLVHFHDVYLPLPYPKDWSLREYDEQMLLACLILYSGSRFEPMIANSYASACHPDKFGLSSVGRSFWMVVK